MNSPKIRFKGYTDDWEQRKFGELMKENQKPVPKPSGGYTRLGIRSHAKGTFHEVIPEGGGLDVDTMYVVEANNLIVNITFAWEEAWAITTKDDAEKLVSHRFPQYKFNLDQDPIFYKYRLNNSRMKHDLELASPGGAGRNRVLNRGEFLKILVDVSSSLEEQKKIASYFATLDRLITLHQRKCEQTKLLKKYMLQKMFPADGARVPEIRFEGFTDDWEQRKLGEIADSYSGGTPSVGNSDYYGGDIPFIRSAEINSDSTELFLTEKGLENSSAKMVKKGDILYALYGATSGETGLARLNGAINQAILDIRPYTNYDASFIMYWLRKSKEEIIGTYLQGGQGNLSGSIVTSLKICCPAYEEQQQIGSYFANLDHLITLHQRKCEELQNLKKFMLQNMFV